MTRPSISRTPGLFLGLTVAALCLVDVAATHYEITRLNVQEANVLMLPVIAHGWAGVWALKVALAAVVALTGAQVWRSKFGKCAMVAALGGNLAANACHLTIGFSLFQML